MTYRLALIVLASLLCGSSHASDMEDSIMQVSFPSGDGLQLEGTLRLPCLPCSQASTGVVLMHGSGPISRDAVINLSRFGFAIPIFQEIAQALVDNGIAVLTYDKRSCGTFNNCYNNNYPLPDANLTVDDFYDDATAAINFLQSRSDIDDIVIIGHSQSGKFVPILLEAKPELAGGVMVAAAYHPVDQVLQDQYDFLLQSYQDAGLNESAAQATLQPTYALVEDAHAARNGSSTSGSAAFWNSWFDFAPRALEAAAEVTQPLLVMNGLLDAKVFSSEAEAWAEYLETEGVVFEIELMPCITHVMNCVTNAASPSLINVTTDQVGRHVDSEVTDLLTDFVLAAAPAKASTGTGSEAIPSAAPGKRTSLWMATSMIFNLPFVIAMF